MPTNIEVWTIGNMAATHGLEIESALATYAEAREISRDQMEIFRDGFAGLHRDYALDLDAAFA